MISFSIAIESSDLLAKAKQLSKSLKIPLVSIDSLQSDYLLIFKKEGLVLQNIRNKREKGICINFLSPQLTYRRTSTQRELLKQALGTFKEHVPFIVDATAGFGEDAFILASKGYNVLMLERSPVLAALLRDGLERMHDQINKTVSLELRQEDAKIYLPQLAKTTTIDVVYLDPMFPERKKSALPVRKMAILREIVGENEDADVLLEIARTVAKNRVVVKRPRYAPSLANQQPSFSLYGSAARFDVYV